MNRKYFLILCAVLLMAVQPLNPLIPQGNTGALQKVVSRMRSLGSFTGSISIGSGSGGFVRGKLYYQNRKIHLALSDGRTIASNGKFLTVYSPGTGVAGKQEMYSGGGGLGWILRGYKATVSGNSARLIAENPNSRIKSVQLSWSSKFVLRSLNIQYKNDSSLQLTIGAVKKVQNISVSQFSWRPPAGSRVVENPLNQRN